MVVVGGGVIGLELACAYAVFGTKITVVEALDHILPMLDGEVTRLAQTQLRRLGIDLRLQCRCSPWRRLTWAPGWSAGTEGRRPWPFEAEKVLVAVGRKANTAALDLEAGGIAHDRGRIIVNDRMETSVPGVYAIGDCVLGRAQLAHTASAMAR